LRWVLQKWLRTAEATNVNQSAVNIIMNQRVCLEYFSIFPVVTKIKLKKCQKVLENVHPQL
jgi:hypothetical protein